MLIMVWPHASLSSIIWFQQHSWFESLIFRQPETAPQKIPSTRDISVNTHTQKQKRLQNEMTKGQMKESHLFWLSSTLHSSFPVWNAGRPLRMYLWLCTLLEILSSRECTWLLVGKDERRLLCLAIRQRGPTDQIPRNHLNETIWWGEIWLLTLTDNSSCPDISSTLRCEILSSICVTTLQLSLAVST